MAGPQIHDHRFIYHNAGGNVVSFEASDQDTSDGTYHYYGYLSSFGSWVIQRFEIGVGTISYRYASGQDEYAAAWAGKALLDYGYFNEITELA